MPKGTHGVPSSMPKAMQDLPSSVLKKRKRGKGVKARSVVQVDSKPKAMQVLHSGELKLCDGEAVVESSSLADFAIKQAPSPQAKARSQVKQGNAATGNCEIASSSAQAKREETEKAYAIATKANDTAVPVHLWDRRALGLPKEDRDLGPCPKQLSSRLCNQGR